jgi:hypothetical protein
MKEPMQFHDIDSSNVNLGKGRSRGRVSGLNRFERGLVRDNLASVILTNCEPYEGCTLRKVVYINGRYYTRMPSKKLIELYNHATSGE